MLEITRSSDRVGASFVKNDGTGVAAGVARSVVYEGLEAAARKGVQEFLQRILEEEVTCLLGRAPAERRAPNSPFGYRNAQETTRFEREMGKLAPVERTANMELMTSWEKKAGK